MDDNDLIRRGDALAAVQVGDTVTKTQARIRAIPSVDADPVCTDCGGTGVTYQTERRCACQPALTPASDGRAEGLREAAVSVATADAMVAAGLRVKPLEWEETEDCDGERFHSATPLGVDCYYAAEHVPTYDGTPKWRLWCSLVRSDLLTLHDNLEAAKAAAQADYEARILAALESTDE